MDLKSAKIVRLLSIMKNSIGIGRYNKDGRIHGLGYIIFHGTTVYWLLFPI
jgi:hypothetical protein